MKKCRIWKNNWKFKKKKEKMRKILKKLFCSYRKNWKFRKIIIWKLRNCIKSLKWILIWWLNRKIRNLIFWIKNCRNVKKKIRNFSLEIVNCKLKIKNYKIRFKFCKFNKKIKLNNNNKKLIIVFKKNLIKIMNNNCKILYNNIIFF